MDTHEKRMRREAAALEIVKAYRPKGHPEHPETIFEPQIVLTHTALPGIDSAAPGIVYFLYCAGLIKIGYTTDLTERLGDFRTHCPMPVTLLLTIRGCPEDERGYHEMFALDRVRGEWFHPSLHLREFLSCNFGGGTQELMLNAEDETRECFETAREYWIQLEREMAECPPFQFSVQI